MFLFKADIGAKVFANDALPRGEESIIEELLKFFSQVYILEFGGARGFLLDELDGSESHIYKK